MSKTRFTMLLLGKLDDVEVMERVVADRRNTHQSYSPTRERLNSILKKIDCDKIQLVSDEELSMLRSMRAGAKFIKWSVEDFRKKAKKNIDYENEFRNIPEPKRKKVEEVYDDSKYPEAFRKMIANHDCNHGITWTTVDDYLGHYCERANLCKDI